MELAVDFLDRAIVARIPALIKAREPDASGRRIVEVEASTEEIDYDGDVILQSALMGSAREFVATGHFDIDHLSEFGARMGIPNPERFIIGRPMDVTARTGGRTFVKGEIARSSDGKFDPDTNVYDSFWASLRQDPPVIWYSSIYGFPTDLDDCTKGQCSESGAKRYLIKSIDWRSLAFTRTPKNTALSSPTRILSAKSYLIELAKAMKPEETRPTTKFPLAEGMQGPPIGTQLPNTMADVWMAKNCTGCGANDYPSLLGYRSHFAKCLGFPPGAADICAHAVMHRHGMEERMPNLPPYPGLQAMPGT